MKEDRWVVEFRNEWKQLRGGYNWYSFTFFNLYFENEKMTHGYEFEFVVLGLGIRIRYNTDKALELFKEWAEDNSVEDVV